MLESLVLVYVGEQRRGLEIVQVLDQRLNRPVHLLTSDADGLGGVLESSLVDGVVCGMLDSEALQTVVDMVADSERSVPILDLSGSIAAVPETVELHRIDGDEGDAANDLVGGILAEVQQSRLARGLGQYLAVDEEWTVTDWDPRLESWTAISPTDAVGTGLWETVPDWRETAFADRCEDVMTDRQPVTEEFYLESADRWFDCRVVPLADGGVECFVRDITEYKREDTDAFDGPTEGFENTLERITDGFFALDNEDRFVLLNSRAENVLNVDEEEVLGVRFWDAFPAAMTTSFYNRFDEAMQSQEPTSFEERYRPSNRWFEVNAYPSEDGLSVFLRDVTEQMRLQKSLESLYDVTRELIVAESDTAIGEQTVEAAEEILEFELVAVWRYNEATDRLDPLAWSGAIDDRDVEMSPLGRDSEFIWDVYENAETRELGFVPATTSTSHHPGKVTSELLVPVGEYGVLGAYSDDRDAFDETDVKLFRLLASTVESAFARTRRERQLAQRNERLNDFASVVSHDLRNPLNVASAHAELAREATEAAPHLDKIDDSLRRMETLIEDLLARARGDQDLEREPLSLSTIADVAWEGVDTAEATLSTEDEASLDADPDRLTQLFENLFRNAIEHGGDSVTVRVGTTDDGFFVADDGPGIPADEREEIFEQGVTHAEDGTGYGLAIVTDIADGHGWSVTVDESAAGGARFDVRNVRSLADAPEASN